MIRIRSLTDMVRRLAMNDPEAAFLMLEDVPGLEHDRRQGPELLDYDGDPVRPYETRSTYLDGCTVAITEYPYGTVAISIADGQAIIVRRKQQGSVFRVSHYVHEQALERLRATGMFGEIEDHDPSSFMELLAEHGILKANGLNPRNAWDPDYVGFLHERRACAAVIDE